MFTFILGLSSDLRMYLDVIDVIFFAGILNGNAADFNILTELAVRIKSILNDENKRRRVS